MWDTLMDLFLLLAIGGWLMLWLLRDRGHFGVRRGMATAPRRTNPSPPRRPVNEGILPDGDKTTRRSTMDIAQRHVDNPPGLLDKPGRRLGSGTRRRSCSARRQPARMPRPHGRARQRSSQLRAVPEQPSATPRSTRASRSNP